MFSYTATVYFPARTGLLRKFPFKPYLFVFELSDGGGLGILPGDMVTPEGLKSHSDHNFLSVTGAGFGEFDRSIVETHHDGNNVQFAGIETEQSKIADMYEKHNVKIPSKRLGFVSAIRPAPC